MIKQANAMSARTRSTHTLQAAVIGLCLSMGAILPFSTTLAAPDKEIVSSTPTSEQSQPIARSQSTHVAASEASTLDLDSLSERLRETKAIGLFAKLALKKKVDALIEEVANFHKGDNEASLRLLRGDYEHLIAHTLELLHEGDAELHQDLSTSREALWDVLADPTQFIRLCRMDTICDIELIASLR